MYRIIKPKEISFCPYPKGKAEIKRVLKFERGQAKFEGFGFIKIPPGGVFEPHIHPEKDEVYLILKGKGLLLLKGKEILVNAGTAIYISGPESHGLKNTGKRELVYCYTTAFV